jgi:hypothetical protein
MRGEKQLEDLLNEIINHEMAVDKNDYLWENINISKVDFIKFSELLPRYKKLKNITQNSKNMSNSCSLSKWSSSSFNTKEII